MVSRLPSPEATLALWGLLAVGTGVFTGTFDPVATGVASRLAKAAGLVAVTYGCALVVGAAAAGTAPPRPLAGLGQWQAIRVAEARTLTTIPALEA